MNLDLIQDKYKRRTDIEINKDNNIDILKSKSIEEAKSRRYINRVEEQETNIIDEGAKMQTNIIEIKYKAHF